MGTNIDDIERKSNADNANESDEDRGGGRGRNSNPNMKTDMSRNQKGVLFLVLFTLITMRLEVPAALSNVGGGEFVEPKYEAFNRTNPHVDSWCPYAQCFNSPICAPCNRRYLFIIATGRSGSTTLLKMLNLLPNVRISGENYNELYFASQLVSKIENDRKNFYDPELMKKITTNEQGNGNFSDHSALFMHAAVEDGAFMHNAMPIGSMACVQQKLVSTLNPPDLTPNKDSYKKGKSGNDSGGGGLLQYLNHPEVEAKQILGVKTIRLQKSPDFIPYRAKRYLTENFPCARFIINVRSDAEAQAQSVINAFKRDEYEKALEENKNQTKYLKKLAFFLNQNNGGKDNTDRARLIDMEDWKDDVSILNDLLDWLGFENCSFPKVLHENGNGYEHDNSELSLGEKCVYPHL